MSAESMRRGAREANEESARVAQLAVLNRLGSDEITLRDYFAAKAMTALLPLCGNDAREEGLSFPEHIAAVSYGMADAMLKARAS